ncbi:MAG: Z1 domain-containing protein [Actinomycetes bacterium]
MMDTQGNSGAGEEAVMTPEQAAQDPVIQQILIWTRNGYTLDAAVRTVRDAFPSNPRQIENAERLIRALSLRTAHADIPRGAIGGLFETWYSGATRSLDPRWDSLCRHLEAKGWTGEEGEAQLAGLNQASDKILGLMACPVSDEGFDNRGLVIGYVQSGKTQNFTAVMAKAADSGYRLVIILSGLHNALRDQTQERLDEQLFAPSGPNYLWMTLTDEEDFGESIVDPNAALAENHKNPVYLVVKKNASRLRSLLEWIKKADPQILDACPTLIIDDEADQASVNTNDLKNDPTTINRCIRDILGALPKSSYVAYTATPFANVLIDPMAQDEAQRFDLYPRDFIVSLPKPAGYVGTEEIFGREPLEFDTEDPESLGHDLIRTIPDEEIEYLKPSTPANRWEFFPDVTESLADAIKYFLLSTAARRARMDGESQHATALVHTDQHTVVHERTANVLRHFVSSLSEAVAVGDQRVIESLRITWADECESVPASSCGLDEVDWATILNKLPSVLEDVRVVEDNSNSEDRLVYDDKHPSTVIAVGGNTLSRGLTLEGLSVSFFIRTASAYDTLLQMARWFGYKEPYLDVTRIWLTDELRKWFTHLATVEQEIRYEIERYETEHLTPLELGVRIRTHPQLAITAAAKMRKAMPASVSYAGRRLQTILFSHKNRDWLEGNMQAGVNLVSRISERPVITGRNNAVCFTDVGLDEIVSFLGDYQFHERSRELNADLISEYIKQMAEEGELERFTVALMSKATPREDRYIDLGSGNKLGCIDRSRLGKTDATYADIKALMSLVDRAVDMPQVPSNEIKIMNQKDISKLRNQPEVGRGDGSGLLLLYAIAKDSPPLAGSQERVAMGAVEDLLGVGLVFPDSVSFHPPVGYQTADLSRVVGDVHFPDETDAPDELIVDDELDGGQGD